MIVLVGSAEAASDCTCIETFPVPFGASGPPSMPAIGGMGRLALSLWHAATAAAIASGSPRAAQRVFIARLQRVAKARHVPPQPPEIASLTFCNPPAQRQLRRGPRRA